MKRVRQLNGLRNESEKKEVYAHTRKGDKKIMGSVYDYKQNPFTTKTSLRVLPLKYVILSSVFKGGTEFQVLILISIPLFGKKQQIVDKLAYRD
jgi:hypothetical protein